MNQYPDEKSNNPYATSMQPPVPAPRQLEQNQYQAPLGPPPEYTQEPPHNPRDSSRQGYNPQSQVYQSQTYQAPLGSASQHPPSYPQEYQTPPAGHYDQKGGEYPAYAYQQASQGARYPNDQNRPGPSGYPLYQQNSSLSPYSQTPGAVPQDRAPSPNEESRGLSLASFFGNTGSPPMWNRKPPQDFVHNQFPPMCLISNNKDLSKGFPEVPPPCQLCTHPFATHDIMEEDWKRFLADVKKAASLSGGQRIKSNAIPFIAGISLVGGFFLTKAIENRMKTKNRSAAGDVIDHIGFQYFFGPRRVEVILCQGSERLSGREGAAPLGDPNQRHMANGLRRRASSCSSSSSSSSSSSDSEDCRDRSHHRGNGHGSYVSHKSDKRERRAERREAKAERRQEKRARKSERRSGKARSRKEHSEPYQLFIQAI